MQTFYDGALQSGQALNDALNAKGSDGKSLTTEQGLQAFVGEAGLFSQAMGSGGKATTGLNLQDIAQKSGQQGKLQQAYQDDILSGKELSDAIANGTDIGSAVQQFTADAAAFGSVLPTQFVSDNAAKLQQTFSDTLSDAVLGNATQFDLTTAFADSNGNFDTAKLTDAINQAEQQDPNSFKDSNGNQIKTDQIVAAVAAVFTEVRQGAKLSDSLAKLSKLESDDLNKIFPGLNEPFAPKLTPPTGVVADAYNKGLLHAVSALFSGGVLAAKGVEGGSSPTVPASLIAGSFQVMGGLMEAGSKYSKTLPSSSPLALDSGTLKQIESSGKAIGGAGGIIAGALGIFSGVQSLKNGDTASGAVGLAGGITSAWSGVAGLLEGGVGLADTFGAIGSDVAAGLLAPLAATSATLGIIGAGVGILGFLGLGIYELVEESKHTFQFTDQTSVALKQYGITGGPVQPSDVTPLPMVPQGVGQ